MWGAIAGGCVTENRGIKTSKLYENTLDSLQDVKVHEKLSQSEKDDYTYYIESIIY